jgi:RNA recognition motif-containing protein
LLKETNKKGSAFIEFETTEIAQKILKEFNGKIVNRHLLKLNWTKLSLKNNNHSTNNNINNNNKNNDNNNIFNIHNKNKKFTVSKIHFN